MFNPLDLIYLVLILVLTCFSTIFFIARKREHSVTKLKYIIIILIAISIVIIPLIVTYYVVGYDVETHTKGLVASSIPDARRFFKGSEPNDTVGEKVEVLYKLVDGDADVIRFSKSEMTAK